MIIHTSPHPLAGHTVRLRLAQPLHDGSTELVVEDWADRLYGRSWIDAHGNPAAMHYAIRVGRGGLPIDDHVVYGHSTQPIPLGHIVHVCEIVAESEEGAA